MFAASAARRAEGGRFCRRGDTRSNTIGKCALLSFDTSGRTVGVCAVSLCDAGVPLTLGPLQKRRGAQLDTGERRTV
jgi:hypothetical protein